MAILGDNTTPPNQSWFDVTGNKEYWTAGQYTMPSGGGTVTGMYVYVGGYQGSINIKMCIWDSNANLVWNSGNVGVGTSIGWVFTAVPNIFLSAGNYELGFWSSGHPIWKFENVGGVNYRSGLSGPAANNTNNDEYSGKGFGRLACYCVYTPGTPTPAGGVAIRNPDGTLSRHPINTFDHDGTWHWRPLTTLDQDTTFHRRA